MKLLGAAVFGGLELYHCFVIHQSITADTDIVRTFFVTKINTSICETCKVLDVWFFAASLLAFLAPAASVCQCSTLPTIKYSSQ